MHIEITDFNGAEEYFDSSGSVYWSELHSILAEQKPHLQLSGQSGRTGVYIFDPKATNNSLTDAAAELGWRKVPVPPGLQEFGLDWDAGKEEVLVEWQFSNYPFLWNNVIRTEAVAQAQLSLDSLKNVRALVIVTKSGRFPASNSTLYYEQAKAQLSTVTRLGVFEIPIRLVGLMFPEDATEIDAFCNTYGARYSRAPLSSQLERFDVRWGLRARRYGNHEAVLTRQNKSS